ncbi:MAG TPA: DUF2062 domain-containing protein [Syntrophales bacterium]|nr:DUF2062 domain-containing protein [Syntrophales bacterium]
MKRYLINFYNKFISLKGEPKNIAMGFALGVFVGVTPTIPFHTGLLVALGLASRQNITSAYIGAWAISNPLTVAPFYILEYQIGKYLLGMGNQPLVLKDYSIMSIMNFGWDVTFPLLAGGLIVAPFFAVPAYFVAHRMVLAIRRRRHHHVDHT